MSAQPDTLTVETQPDGTHVCKYHYTLNGETHDTERPLGQSTGDDYLASATVYIGRERSWIEGEALNYLLELRKAGGFRDAEFQRIMNRYSAWKAHSNGWDALTGDAKVDYAIAMFADDPRTEPSLTEWRKTRQQK